MISTSSYLLGRALGALMRPVLRWPTNLMLYLPKTPMRCAKCARRGGRHDEYGNDRRGGRRSCFYRAGPAREIHNQPLKAR